MQANGIAQTVLFCCLLMAAAVWDIQKREVPDVLCFLILMTGLLSFKPENLLGLLLGLPLFIAAFINQNCMGGGDVKFTAAVGFVLGFRLGAFGLILGLTAAMVYFLGSQFAKKLKHIKTASATETALPMLPFLSAGFIAAHFMN